MNTQKFSVFEALVFGLKTILVHFRVFFLSYLAFLGVTVLCAAVVWQLNEWVIGAPPLLHHLQALQACKGPECLAFLSSLFSYKSGLRLFLGAICFIPVIGVSFGFVRVALDFYDRGDSSVRQLFSCFRVLHKLLVAGFLYGLIVFSGLLLFVVPRNQSLWWQIELIRFLKVLRLLLAACCLWSVCFLLRCFYSNFLFFGQQLFWLTHLPIASSALVFDFYTLRVHKVMMR